MVPMGPVNHVRQSDSEGRTWLRGPNLTVIKSGSLVECLLSHPLHFQGR